MAKRYLLLLADGGITEPEWARLDILLQQRHPGAKLIGVRENPRAIIVRTTTDGAASLRSPEGALALDGKALRPVLTSGAVGNLKRRAREAATDGQVHE